MSDKAYTDGLNYDLIKRAVHGEKDALEEILRIYEPFHNALVTREAVGPDGKIYVEVKYFLKCYNKVVTVVVNNS